MNDYKDHPESVLEIKSNLSQTAVHWTPRDALISALRDIDAGKISPCALIVGCAQVHEDGGVTPHFYLAAPNGLVALGLIAYVEKELKIAQF